MGNDFHADLKFASNSDYLNDIYHKYWPTITSIEEVTDLPRQKQGIDKIITLANGKQITIDEKIRRKDYGDFLVEEWSNLEAKKVGWTLDPNKVTDYIIWVTPDRVKILDYEQLRRTCQIMLPEWKKTSTRQEIANRGYRTICWPIPWGDLYLATLKLSTIALC